MPFLSFSSNQNHFHLFLQFASILLASLLSLPLITLEVTLFEVTVSMIKIILWSYLYTHMIIKTKYTVIQFCSILMLIFHSKKSIRTQTTKILLLFYSGNSDFCNIFLLYIHFIFHSSVMHLHGEYDIIKLITKSLFNLLKNIYLTHVYWNKQVWLDIQQQ